MANKKVSITTEELLYSHSYLKEENKYEYSNTNIIISLSRVKATSQREKKTKRFHPTPW